MLLVGLLALVGSTLAWHFAHRAADWLQTKLQELQWRPVPVPVYNRRFAYSASSFVLAALLVGVIYAGQKTEVVPCGKKDDVARALEKVPVVAAIPCPCGCG